MKIYTKTGDAGETGLFRGPRVPKHDPRVEAYGNVDELNAVLGVALLEVQQETIRSILLAIQHELFEVGADLATPPQPQEDEKYRIPVSFTSALEKQIDSHEASLAPLQQFILPGGSAGSAWLHYARTVCRRAERSVAFLQSEMHINAEILKYLNRLSDLLFVLARAENAAAGASDIPWKKRE